MFFTVGLQLGEGGSVDGTDGIKVLVRDRRTKLCIGGLDCFSDP